MLELLQPVCTSAYALPGVGIKGYEGHASMWEYRILLERFLDSALLALGDFSADTHTLPLAA